MATVKINVTQKNIDKAIKMLADDSNRRSLVCAITQAFKDAGYLEAQTVHGFCFLKGVLKHSSSVALPAQADKFITDFDNNKTVSPFSFEVQITDAMIKGS